MLANPNVSLQELLDLFDECREELDNYSDGEYIDGRPMGNKALRLVGDIDDMLERLNRG